MSFEQLTVVLYSRVVFEVVVLVNDAANAYLLLFCGLRNHVQAWLTLVLGQCCQSIGIDDSKCRVVAAAAERFVAAAERFVAAGEHQARVVVGAEKRISRYRAVLRLLMMVVHGHLVVVVFDCVRWHKAERCCGRLRLARVLHVVRTGQLGHLAGQLDVLGVRAGLKAAIGHFHCQYAIGVFGERAVAFAEWQDERAVDGENDGAVCRGRRDQLGVVGRLLVVADFEELGALLQILDLDVLLGGAAARQLDGVVAEQLAVNDVRDEYEHEEACQVAASEQVACRVQLVLEEDLQLSQAHFADRARVRMWTFGRRFANRLWDDLIRMNNNNNNNKDETNKWTNSCYLQ